MKRVTKSTLYILAGLVLIASLVLGGCESKEITAEELLTNTLLAMEKVDSYKIDYEIAMDMATAGSQYSMNMTMEADGEGAMDVRAQKTQMIMEADVNMSRTGTAKMDMSMSMEMYVVDGWAYTKMDVPGSGVQWTKMEIPAGSAQDPVYSQDQLAQLLVLMRSAITSNLSGTEKVDGVNCYVLVLEPDIAALWDWMMSQQGSALTGNIDLDQYDLSEIIKDFSMKYWIAQNNYQIVKAQSSMTMDMNAETLGVSEEGFESMTMTMDMSMSFYGYNETVTIDLPADAANAVEMNMDQY